MIKFFVILILLSSNAFAQRDINAKVTDYVRDLRGDISILKKWNSVLNRQPIKAKQMPSLSLEKVWKSVKGEYIADIYNYADFWFPPDFFDYWATPFEFKKKGGGDCEDFAISWYYAARAQGFVPSQLNLWMGYLPKKDNIQHMVLAIDFKGREYVFDNYSNKILLASEYMQKDFKLMYRFNELGWRTD